MTTKKMTYQIKKVGVLGAGIMGSSIAGLLAGCDFEVLLLDCTNELTQAAAKRLQTSKPPLIYSATDLSKIKVGNYDHDIEKLTHCDWIIEAVLEKADLKQKIYQRIEPYLRADTIVSSNTSGLGWHILTKNLSDGFKQRFLITHFFNPPRYLKLVEIVAGPKTETKSIKAITELCENRLGKGVVLAKDTPNFVANRIGVTHVMDVMHLTLENKWPIEAVDKVLGPATGRPKSAIFRTADLVGLDTLTYVAENILKGCPDDEMLRRLRIPNYLLQMIAKNLLGQKTGSGFYKKDPKTKEILSMDLETLTYRAQEKFSAPSLKQAKDILDPQERIKQVVLADDEAGKIAWTTISRMLTYAANRLPEIADNIYTIDRAMRWGFNWSLGPFETWDALGVKKVCAKLEKQGTEIPELAQKILLANKDSFYTFQASKRLFFDLQTQNYLPEPDQEKITILKNLGSSEKIVAQNSSASLYDLEDGIFCCAFHAKMNAIDGDIITMINQALDLTEKQGQGLIIANQEENFSVGANLLLILMLAEQNNWEELEKVVRGFQATTQRIRFSEKPVVVVPFGLTLGGGYEICVAAPKRQAAMETYLGLVETGAGLIPAGGGCKNLLLQMEKLLRETHLPKDQLWSSPVDGGPFPKVWLAFEKIAMAKVTSSAKEAKQWGMLNQDDGLSLDQDKLIFQAKQTLLELIPNYQPPKPREDICLPGKGGKMALINFMRDFKSRDMITDHDLVVGRKLAHILTGGDQPTMHKTTENHLLDLECEAFLGLCGLEKTKERMKHLLLTGKPLRN
ncbi:MAG: 3-hydroxyacyl-CoA dehydrogenase/enoyl-CoA hydratase family protein [Pseudomonadota bacterium]